MTPMTFGSMRANGVKVIAVSCVACHHSVIVGVTNSPDEVPVPMFGPRMGCTACGAIGADARPN